MSENNRPEWANGPEWEGWEWLDAVGIQRCMERDIANGLLLVTLTIYGDGALTISGEREEVAEVKCVSPAHALTAANAISEAAGGWA